MAKTRHDSMCFTPLDPLEDTESISRSPIIHYLHGFTPLDPLEDTESVTDARQRDDFACFTPLDPLEDTERNQAQ